MRGQRHAAAALCPGKDPVPILQEAGWAPGPVENLAPTGIRFDLRTVQSVASRYTDYATRPTILIIVIIIIIIIIIAYGIMRFYYYWFVLMYYPFTQQLIRRCGFP